MYDDGPWCGFAPRVDREKPLGPGNYGPSTSWLGFFETKTAPQDGPCVYDRAAIALALKGPLRAFTGQPISLTLSLLNGSAQPLQYGMPVDGSFEHWRAPFVDLYAREQGSGRTYRWTFGKDFGRCGNVDSRKAADYVTLPRGTRKLDPFGPNSHVALAPVVTTSGRYTLWVVYASSCMGADIGASTAAYDAPRPADLFEGTIASNGFTLDVTAEP